LDYVEVAQEGGENNLKKLFLTLIVAVFLIAPGLTFAQEGLVDPGITPDSIFYFLDTWSEKIVEFFAFSDEAKVEVAIAQAEERLAEAETMADQGLNELADQTRQRYQERIETALQRATQAREQVRERVMEQIAQATSKHFGVLKSRLEQVEDATKDALQNALEVSNRGLETSLEVLSQEKRGEILKNLQNALPDLEESIQKGAGEGRQDLDVVKEELQDVIDRSKEDGKNQSSQGGSGR
jgi:hypothetical protein